MIHPRFPGETVSPSQRPNSLQSTSAAGYTSPAVHWVTALLAADVSGDILDHQTFTPWKAMRIQSANADFAQDAGTQWNRWLERDSTPYFLPLFNNWDLEPAFLEKAFWRLHSESSLPWAGTFSVLKDDEGIHLWNTGFESGETFLRASLMRSPVLIRHQVWKELGGFRSGLSPVQTLWEFWLRAARQGIWGITIPEYLAWLPQPYREETPGTVLEKTLEESQTFFNKRTFPSSTLRTESLAETEVLLQRSLPAFHHPSKRESVLFLISPQPTLGERIELLKLANEFRHLGWDVKFLLTGSSDPSQLADWSAFSTEVFALGNFLSESNFPVFIKSFLETRRPGLLLVNGHAWNYHLMPWLRSWFPTLPIADWRGFPPRTEQAHDQFLANPLLVNQSWCQQAITESWLNRKFPLKKKPLRLYMPPLPALAENTEPNDKPALKVLFLHSELKHSTALFDLMENFSSGISNNRWTLVSEKPEILAAIRAHPIIKNKVVLHNYRDWMALLEDTELVWIPHSRPEDLALIQSSVYSRALFLLPENELADQLKIDKSSLVFSGEWKDDPAEQFQRGILPLLKKPETLELQRKRKYRHNPESTPDSGLSKAIHQLFLTSGMGGNVTLPPQLGDIWLDLNQRLQHLEKQVEQREQRIQELQTSMDRHEIDLGARLYYAQGSGFQENLSINRKITPGKFYRLRFSLSQIAGITGLRLDPVDFPGIITIDSILLFRELTFTPLWNSDAFPRFDGLTLDGTATLLESLAQWKILAYGPDPQILIPWKEEWTQYRDLALEVRMSTQLDLRDLLPLLKPPAPHVEVAPLTIEPN